MTASDLTSLLLTQKMSLRYSEMMFSGALNTKWAQKWSPNSPFRIFFDSSFMASRTGAVGRMVWVTIHTRGMRTSGKATALLGWTALSHFMVSEWCSVGEYRQLTLGFKQDITKNTQSQIQTALKAAFCNTICTLYWAYEHPPTPIA